MSVTNKVRSANSVIVGAPGTMYNEITRPKPHNKQYNNNTNTHAVTIPYSQTVNIRKSKSKNGKNKNK